MPRRTLDPLPNVAFHILLDLVGGDLHGYGTLRDVAEQTDNQLRLGPGTLYGSLRTLVQEKLIQEVDGPDDEGSERRRYYRLTAAGRKLARSESDRLADLLRVARAKGILRGDHV